jgi:hypothetical protein
MGIGGGELAYFGVGTCMVPFRNWNVPFRNLFSIL